ncbi:6-phosphogluconolactonase [Bacterioplanes sanyensis]|uniref:6-phosphogluconolactonase n=1 Tax=Bacterioplanes sanyensis TaxID=1249553 RepID=A0A222FKD8_9GAMM|nr:6-phosphogluconolactonase [Bacterioplanes sanyensis]ASP39478.1 6-phosphogluconolactonase [Bacterioplanes sanyensis]
MIIDNHFEQSDVLAAQLASDVAGLLQRAVEQRGRACLAVSGGTTPVLFFQQLAQQTISWQHVLITLVDERWVAPTDPQSNAALVQQHLLQHRAQEAFFLALFNDANTPEDGFMMCENRLHELVDQLDVAVLGMGNDGHTASWFPHSSALGALLDPLSHGRCYPVADQTPPRMSLTWGWLKHCEQLYLHFEGEQKNRTYEMAKGAAVEATHVFDSGDIHAMPVRTLLQGEVPLSIYRS